jgi:Kef-type K+ transport system membrane component KefB
MNLIRTQLHGLIDYLMAGVLLLPWITEHGTTNKDTIVFSAIGFGIITLSLITDYEFGLIKLVPMRIHLLLDILVSIFIMAMPFLFPVVNYYLYWPVILGLSGLLITILSSSRPYIHKRQDPDITKPYH